MLQQFLRFGETKSIAQEIILQDAKEKQEQYVKQSTRNESEIKKFIQRTNMSMQSYMRSYESRHLFLNRLPYIHGSRLMSPPSIHSFSPNAAHDLRPPSIPIQSTSPVSPLGRLQTMQPFDFRREASSPAVSPGLVDKRLSSQSSSSESPQNLSSTPTPILAPTIPQIPQAQPTEPIEAVAASTSLVMTTLPQESEHETNAINYCTKELTSSIYAERKIRHLRKSANPIKRHWTPSTPYCSTFLSPSGKKRVLCTACNKSFCDKGALKIHYSAVHLKEMHKCSIDGCNMMFSSRRSRNRHSANPNPKLHVPQKRKLPDGATLMPSIVRSNVRLISSPPTMVVAPSMVPRPPFSGLNCSPDYPRDTSYFDIARPLNLFSPEKRIKLEEEYNMAEDDSSCSMYGDLSNESKLEDSSKHDSGYPRGINKRKSLLPTRYALVDMAGPASDENSNDREGKSKDTTENSDNGQRMSVIESTLIKKEPVTSSMDLSITPPGPESFGLLSVSALRNHIMDNDLSMKGNGRKEAQNFPRIASLLASATPKLNNKSLLSGEASPSSSSVSPESDHESESSNTSSDCKSPGLSNGSRSAEDSIDIPIDKDNPRKCFACGKQFLNHFSLKTHYKNIHLKLLHVCTIAGCDASFPSKRSRDRHSLNVNLHRKVTSDEQRNDDDVPYSDGARNGMNDSKSSTRLTRSSADDSMSDSDDDKASLTDEREAVPDQETDADGLVTCHVCDMRFRDNLILKEHFEIVHPKEMFHCTVSGCEKIFSTRKSRNRHSLNDNLHRIVSSAKTNGLS